MAVQIVDQLEVIEIEKQRADLRMITARPLDLVDQELAQVTRIVQARKFISQRQPLSISNPD